MSWLRLHAKSLLLVASLALNLFVLGMVVSHAVMERGPTRISAAGWSQLLPRGFFMDLPPERRRALLDSLKSQSAIFRDGRASLRTHAAQLADALIAEPYDETRIRQALEAFSTEGKSLNEEGSRVALNVIQQLSEGERKQLAEHIQRRARR